ncbi:hypothetical protein FisN_8Lu415 [Fistulifera solaris]|uniref:Uncharacterized protein n=1 Tax=Fistulifera solaris TaxID=1519565 RepID=A0A1Z5JHY0_FISSO|nr:hypothetical protein FisN_8Lu415 [Fistulifera solaris]|eukprot:GAX13378.1 hypothetical protein FisN_8Lu415 [Fistulifera solaris]
MLWPSPRHTGHKFQLLTHPGTLIPYPANATSAQRADANCAHDTAIEDYLCQEYVHQFLRQQIIVAVEPIYMMSLHGTEVGLGHVNLETGSVSAYTMLVYLKDKFTKITAAEIEANCLSLATAWTSDQPIQALWNRHVEIRDFASAIDAWRRHSEADKTYKNFVEYFTAEHEALQEQLTTSTAGYHHANAAGTTIPAVIPPTATASTMTPRPMNPYEVVAEGGFCMYYCWTHGLGMNAEHTSKTCNHPAHGHVHTATLKSANLSVSEARSRVAGYYAAKAKLGALFLNAQNACPLRIALEEMGHPQPATPIQTDNSTAAGIVNDKVKQKLSKAMDMRFYWIRDRARKGQFHVYWKAGAGNKADYFTKLHATSHHRTMCPMYLHDNSSTSYYEAISPHQDVAQSVPDSGL